MFGLLLVAAAAGFTLLHESFLGPRPVFGFYYLAITATALVAGTRSAVYAMAVATVTSFVLLTENSVGIKFVHIGLSVVVSACLIAIV